MHPFFIEQLAKYRREELEQEAKNARLVAQSRYRVVNRRERSDPEVQSSYRQLDIIRLFPRIMLRWIGSI
ncbi:MAG TPA: hypothetical protein VKR06_45710 [Ktedonosporobacter sp.]|nr:hypothetical protein [Ktedonosporobacter sp.]